MSIRKHNLRKDESRIRFINEHYSDVLAMMPVERLDFVAKNSDHGGTDVALEVAGAESPFALRWSVRTPMPLLSW